MILGLPMPWQTKHKVLMKAICFAANEAVKTNPAAPTRSKVFLERLSLRWQTSQ